jgi:hypothetical protein
MEGTAIEGAADEQRLQFSGQTEAYDPEKGDWSELDPLKIPEFDGIQYANGLWLGNEWVGYGLPCRDGKGSQTDTERLCASRHIGLRWSTEAGWRQFDGPPDQLYGGVELPIPAAIGARGSTVIFTTTTGYVLLNVAAEPTWTFHPWPPLTEGVPQGGACLVGNEVWVTATDDPLADAGGPATPTYSVHGIDIDTGEGRLLSRLPDSGTPAPLGLLCEADGMLLQILDHSWQLAGSGALSDIDLPAYSVEGPTGAIKIPLELRDAQASSDQRTYAFGPEAWIFEHGTGLFAQLQSTPDLEAVTAGSSVLFARLFASYDSPAAGEWFQLNTDASVEQLRNSRFPLPADLPVREGPR